LPTTSLDDVEPDRQLLSLFPARLLLKDELLPLRRINGCVEVATSRLFATQGLDTLKTMTGLRLRPVICSEQAIQREMKKRLASAPIRLTPSMKRLRFKSSTTIAMTTRISIARRKDASIIRFVNQVLKDAIDLRASDIHLEPFEDELRIRYRIDGVLQDIPVPPQIKRFQPAIVSRVKILSHLNLRRAATPGRRIKIRVDDSEVGTFRVSVIPMLHGEAVVMRLLRQSRHPARHGELAWMSAN